MSYHSKCMPYEGPVAYSTTTTTTTPAPYYQSGTTIPSIYNQYLTTTTTAAQEEKPPCCKAYLSYHKKGDKTDVAQRTRGMPKDYEDGDWYWHTGEKEKNLLLKGPGGKGDNIFTEFQRGGWQVGADGKITQGEPVDRINQHSAEGMAVRIRFDWHKLTGIVVRYKGQCYRVSNQEYGGALKIKNNLNINPETALSKATGISKGDTEWKIGLEGGGWVLCGCCDEHHQGEKPVKKEKKKEEPIDLPPTPAHVEPEDDDGEPIIIIGQQRDDDIGLGVGCTPEGYWFTCPGIYARNDSNLAFLRREQARRDQDEPYSVLVAGTGIFTVIYLNNWLTSLVAARRYPDRADQEAAGVRWPESGNPYYLWDNLRDDIKKIDLDGVVVAWCREWDETESLAESQPLQPGERREGLGRVEKHPDKKECKCFRVKIGMSEMVKKWWAVPPSAKAGYWHPGSPAGSEMWEECPTTATNPSGCLTKPPKSSYRRISYGAIQTGDRGLGTASINIKMTLVKAPIPRVLYTYSVIAARILPGGRREQYATKWWCPDKN